MSIKVSFALSLAEAFLYRIKSDTNRDSFLILTPYFSGVRHPRGLYSVVRMALKI